MEKTGKVPWELFSNDGRASWRNLRTVSGDGKIKQSEKNTDLGTVRGFMVTGVALSRFKRRTRRTALKAKE